MAEVSFPLADGAMVVTGAAGGIGRAIVQVAASAGTESIIAVDRDAAALEKLREDFPAVEPIVCDLSDSSLWPDLLSSLTHGKRKIRYLVNNAARWDGGPITEISETKWREHFELNVHAPFVLIRGLAPVLKDSGGGSIVNISSRNSLRSSVGMAAYDASKAALSALTRTAAGEFAPCNIRVNTVMPGVVMTPGERASSDEDFVRAYSALIPMGRYAYAGEIASAVLFLLSEGSAFITGEALLVDGGQMACQDNERFRSLLSREISE